MKNVLWKLKILRRLLAGAYEEWHREIWVRHPDEPHCCSGCDILDPCGCHGVTVREVYDYER